MIDLREYLESQRKQIVDFMISECIPDSITEKQTFNKIATELQTRFLHNHRGIIGGRDKAHNILAMAIMCSMWCGWLSQAKTHRKVYTQEWVNSFKRSIIDAFEIGQGYSADQP
jgi:hypothetical protein